MNKFLITAITVVSLIPGISSLTINTPASITQCQPTLLTWTNGASPFYLSVLPGGQTNAAPLKSLGTLNGTSDTWVADVTPNQYITFALKDSTGETAFTDQVLVQANNDVSCMNGSPASASAATGMPSSNAPESSVQAAGTKTTPTSSMERETGSARVDTSKTSGHSSSAATGAANDAVSLGVGTFGLASLLGLVGIVLF